MPRVISYFVLAVAFSVALMTGTGPAKAQTGLAAGTPIQIAFLGVSPAPKSRPASRPLGKIVLFSTNISRPEAARIEGIANVPTVLDRTTPEAKPDIGWRDFHAADREAGKRDGPDRQRITMFTLSCQSAAGNGPTSMVCEAGLVWALR